MQNIISGFLYTTDLIIQDSLLVPSLEINSIYIWESKFRQDRSLVP